MVCHLLLSVNAFYYVPAGVFFGYSICAFNFMQNTTCMRENIKLPRSVQRGILYSALPKTTIFKYTMRPIVP